MKRRQFIALVGLGPFSRLSVVRTEGVNPPRVGYLFTSKKAEGHGLWEACRQGLRELGYREGENIILEPRWTEGHQEQLAIGRRAAERSRRYRELEAWLSRCPYRCH